jgi:hypothetical protein
LKPVGTSDPSEGDRVKRVLIAVGVIVALLVPLTAAAKVTKTDKHNAKVECKALRNAAGKTNFAALMHSSKRKAFGLCVKRKSREESRERQAAHTNAAKQCRAERDAMGVVAFRNKWGTNANKRNAFGKCVSQHARANKEDMDDEDQNKVNAAKQCRAERDAMGVVAFRNKWGTNANKRNAFGKCVSSTAKSKHDNQD